MANTPDEYLQLWFKYLKQLQFCTQQISTDTPDDIVDFANAKHAKIFQGSAPHQEQFKSCVFAHTHLYIPDSTFTKTDTFLAFLEYIYLPLHGSVLGVFQDVANGAYADLLPPDFDLKPAKQVFPTSGIQQLLIKALTGDMPESWIPMKKIAPLLDLLAADDKKIKDAVDFVAKPGVADAKKP
jgi:hypothetical protein